MERLKHVAFIAICLIFMFVGSIGVQASDVLIESWAARYNGPGNRDDWVYALAVDATGNVYVTGYSRGAGTYSDYATIKYDADGNELWVARYNGPGNSGDGAEALAVDADGYVYVTGYSYGNGTYYDYATIKYDTDGNELWIARYNGPGNSYDSATDLAVDVAGNVYVTGRSYGIGTREDYATVKYDADGNQLWVARYNGPGNWFRNSDAAYPLAVDTDGNVYVTGWSDGIGTYTDYATVKYDAAGNQLWTARYNGPGSYYDYAYALAVDAAGNVYVTGESYGIDTDYDYATIKYDDAGNELWVARYNGSGNGYDYAYALAVDADGNVYVTGYSYGSGTDYDYVTIKYDNNGNQLWIARYNGPGDSDDYAYGLAVDEIGNVYVTGESYGGSATGYDYATIKYDAAGNQLWTARYDRAGQYSDGAYTLAVDGAGNVYVTGWSYNIGTYRDYVTIKYAAVTPAEAIEHLIATVEGMNLQQGIDNSLDAKLENALAALDAANAGNRSDAINKMEAFINAVEAQRGKALTDAQADQLVALANDIITALGGTTAAPALTISTPSEPQLDQNYPNPFNPETWIPYQLREGADVTVTIYSSTGQLVRRLDLGYKNAGSYTGMEKAVHWDGKNEHGERVSSGLYFYTIQTGEFMATKKMIITE